MGLGPRVSPDHVVSYGLVTSMAPKPINSYGCLFCRYWYVFFVFELCRSGHISQISMHYIYVATRRAQGRGPSSSGQCASYAETSSSHRNGIQKRRHAQRSREQVRPEELEDFLGNEAVDLQAKQAATDRTSIELAKLADAQIAGQLCMAG